jgi:ketosteroid isomerase-like protein
MKWQRIVLVLTFLSLLVVPLAWSQGGKAEQQVKEVNDRYIAAQLRNDSNSLQILMADDFMAIRSDGSLSTKVQEIEHIKSGALTHEKSDIQDVKIRVYGNTAVATVLSSFKGTVNGKPLSSTVRVTRVWVKQAGNWKCVVLQSTRVASAAQNSLTSAINSKALIGAWRLVSVETLRPNGEVNHEWLGLSPDGLIIYDVTGHMSVQIMRDPRPTFAPGRDRPGTPDELKTAYDSYYAYFGTYEVNETESTVLHHVRGSLWPREVGTDYKRHAALSGDRLTLTTTPFQAAGEQRRNRLTFERVR